MRKINLLIFVPLLFVLASWNFRGGDSGNGKVNSDSLFENYIQSLYSSCSLKNNCLDYDLFKKGMIGYYNMKEKGINSGSSIISIIDFQKPSKEERLWVIDLNAKKVLFHSLVAHGKNTGEGDAIRFSNLPESNMSSLGFYVTKNTYCGKHGLSLVIEGLDKGFNNNASARSVVIHGAEYVCEDFIKCNGRLGRSLGCPALPIETHKQIISTIEGGSTLYIHYPEKNYQSVYLDEKVAVKEFMEGE